MKPLKQFNVSYKATSHRWVSIEAENKEQALAKFKTGDYEFDDEHEIDLSDMEDIEVEEVEF